MPTCQHQDCASQAWWMVSSTRYRRIGQVTTDVCEMHLVAAIARITEETFGNVRVGPINPKWRRP